MIGVVFVLYVMARAVLLTAITQAQFKDCGSSNVTMIDVYVGPCNTNPCILYKGSKATININFVVNNTGVEPGNTTATALVQGAEIPIPLDEPDVCKHIKQGCPLKSTNTIYTYSFEAHISEKYPMVNLYVTWRLMNIQNVPFICVQLPLTLSDIP
uniref:MD2-typeB n=1 Tax=Hemigrapsus sanguineus TaxID=40176 RepID=A0A8K1RCV5_HEMSA|nr:MD2-typeB [Hemigrapsus sanguineus]